MPDPQDDRRSRPPAGNPSSGPVDALSTLRAISNNLLKLTDQLFDLDPDIPVYEVVLPIVKAVASSFPKVELPKHLQDAVRALGALKKDAPSNQQDIINLALELTESIDGAEDQHRRKLSILADTYGVKADDVRDMAVGLCVEMQDRILRSTHDPSPLGFYANNCGPAAVKACLDTIQNYLNHTDYRMPYHDSEYDQMAEGRQSCKQLLTEIEDNDLTDPDQRAFATSLVKRIDRK